MSTSLSLSLFRENETTSLTLPYLRIIFHYLPNTRLIGCFVTRFKLVFLCPLLVKISSNIFQQIVLAHVLAENKELDCE